jgi:hypothetical protein
MSNESQRQDMIKAKLRELAELEAQMPQQAEPQQPPQKMNFYEQEEPAQIQQAQYQEQSDQPQQKYYDIEQVLVAMWSETVTSIALEVPMSDFKRSRMLMIRDKLLLEMDLSEFVPQEPPQEQEPVQHQQTRDEEIGQVVDDIVEPKFNEANRDLDTISQKMKDIDSKDGLMQPEVEEEEPSGFKKLLGMGKKKQIERTVDEKHQPSSMG